MAQRMVFRVSLTRTIHGKLLAAARGHRVILNTTRDRRIRVLHAVPGSMELIMAISRGVQFQLFLWRRLTLTAILGLTLATYAVDWLTVVAQFGKPPLVARMEFVAQFLRLDDRDPSHALTVVRNLIAAESRPAHPLAGVPKETTTAMEDPAVRLATCRPGSTDYTEAFRDWSTAVAGATSPTPVLGGLWAYLTHDKYLESGAGGHTYGGSADRRADANLFLDYFRPFVALSFRHPSTWSALADVPVSVRLRPWLLHRFYDEKHFELCDSIPLAVAALLLACSFLLRFLYVDYDPHGAHGPGEPPPRRDGVPLWNPTQPAPYARVHQCPALAALAECLPAIGLLLMVIIEFVADRPETAISWVFKMPTIGLAGLLVPVVWLTVARLRSMQIYRLRRQGRDQAGHLKVLRPFTFGVASTLFVTAWAAAYSAFALLTSTERGAFARGVLQTLAAAYTFYTLWCLIHRLDDQIQNYDGEEGCADPKIAVQAQRDGTAAGPQNEEHENVLAGVFPGLEEIMVRAILLALIPLPEIIKLFG